jgi:hypothetical protein
MGHTDAAALLQENLDEEKAANAKLSELAEGGINQGAADAAEPGAEREEAEEPIIITSEVAKGAARAKAGRR